MGVGGLKGRVGVLEGGGGDLMQLWALVETSRFRLSTLFL
jgi:hypothetical protein